MASYCIISGKALLWLEFIKVGSILYWCIFQISIKPGIVKLRKGTRFKVRKNGWRANVPLGIIMDLSIIEKAPPDTLRSSIGDLISNLSALLDWELGRDRINEVIDDFAYALSLSSARVPTELSPEDFGKAAFISQVAHALVMSRLAMEIAGTSRPCSGAEHAISHAIDELYPERSTFHGLQVAAATPLVLRLHGQDTSELVAFMKKTGIPTELISLGFNNSEIVKILVHARDMRERFTVLNTVTINEKLVRNY